jgi:hypothetical protein
MSASIDAYRKKRVAIVASNPATSKQTGWPIGFWWAEVTHPFWELAQQGYEVEIFSPDGGKLEGDKWSDPRDDSKYSAEDLISLGFVSSPDHRKLIDDSKLLRDLKFEDFDAVLFVGGQGPMYTFWGDSRVHELAAKFYEAGRITAVIAMPRVSCSRRSGATANYWSRGRRGPVLPIPKSSTPTHSWAGKFSRFGSKRRPESFRTRTSS